MKKSFVVLVAAMTVFLIGNLRAGENVDAPFSGETGVIGADYGGVDVWNSTFSAAVSTVGLPAASLQNPQGTYGFLASTTIANTRNKWRVYGVEFSSGNCMDFVDVWQSTGGFGATGLGTNVMQQARMYNVGNSTSMANGAGTCQGLSPSFIGYRWPVRANGNLYFRPSTANYNVIRLLYWKNPD